MRQALRCAAMQTSAGTLNCTYRAQNDGNKCSGTEVRPDPIRRRVSRPHRLHCAVCLLATFCVAFVAALVSSALLRLLIAAALAEDVLRRRAGFLDCMSGQPTLLLVLPPAERDFPNSLRSALALVHIGPRRTRGIMPFIDWGC